MDLLRSFVSGPQGGGAASQADAAGHAEGVETVEKLVERLASAELYEDRRDALRALKALARKYRVEVGSIAMPSLVDAMGGVRHAAELCSLALDAMCSVMGDDAEPDGPAAMGHDDELGERFAEIFIKDKAQVSLVITLLEETDFAIRRPAIHLLTSLLRHCQRQVQDIVLDDPEAISKIMDLLMERREVLRNDAVLMLGEVTRGNANIQKLIAYENAFQVLFEIIGTEAVDSIVIEDCMFVMLNLLKNNGSNQELFREQNLIKTLGNVLECTLWPDDEYEQSDEDEYGERRRKDDDAPRSMGKWTNQRVANVVFLFQAIRCLVAPSNPAKLTAAAQRHIHDFGVLRSLCATLMSTDVTVPVLAEAICTVAEAMRGHADSQRYFDQLKAPTGDKSAVSVLLISMASEKQPGELRYAVLYAFQSYLYRNESAKADVIATLLPTSNEQSLGATVGHYLCTMLVAHEPFQVWLGAMCLLHCILDSATLKEQLLRVQVATSLGSSPASLMSHAMSVLLKSADRKPAARAGVLCLLFEWLRDCPKAVGCFVDSADNINYVTEKIVSSSGGGGEVCEGDERVLRGLAAGLLGAAYLYLDDKLAGTFTRSSLLQLVERRITRELLCDCMESVSRSEPYVRAAQRPQHTTAAVQQQQQAKQLGAGDSMDFVQLDYEFARVWRHMEAQMTSSFRLPSPIGQSKPAAKADNAAVAVTNGQIDRDESQVVQSYKDLIKRQDGQIAELTAQIKRLQHELEDARKKEVNADEVERLRASLAEKCVLIERQNEAMQQKAASSSGEPTPSVDQEVFIRLQKENSEMRAQVDHCVTTANAWQSEAGRCQQIAAQWQQYCIAQTDAHNAGAGGPQQPMLAESAAVSTLQSQLAELETQLTFGYTAYEEQGRRLAAAEGRGAEAEAAFDAERQRCAELQTRLAQCQTELDSQTQLAQLSAEKEKLETGKLNESLAHKESELGEIRKEQEDLLVLLADQDQKIKEYRKRLLSMGQNVSDDESEPEEADDADGRHCAAETAGQNSATGAHINGEPRAAEKREYGARHDYDPRAHQPLGALVAAQGQPVANNSTAAAANQYGNQPTLQNYFATGVYGGDQSVL